MPSNLCVYCGQRPAEILATCSVCLNRVGTIGFGAHRGHDGLVIFQSAFHYGELVQADIYFTETPRVENLELLGRHDHPLPDHAGVVRINEYVGGMDPTSRLMKRTFSASTPSTNGLFRDRNNFVGGVDYDVLAQHGPGRISITYRRAIVQRVLAQGSFDLLD